MSRLLLASAATTVPSAREEIGSNLLDDIRLAKAGEVQWDAGPQCGAVPMPEHGWARI